MQVFYFSLPSLMDENVCLQGWCQWRTVLSSFALWTRCYTQGDYFHLEVCSCLFHVKVMCIRLLWFYFSFRHVHRWSQIISQLLPLLLFKSAITQDYLLITIVTEVQLIEVETFYLVTSVGFHFFKKPFVFYSICLVAGNFLMLLLCESVQVLS